METENRKTIVITGGSDGIGAAAARTLVKEGHRVIIVGRNPEKTGKIAAELGCPYHLADYARLSDVVRLASELAEYDRIDVLANNAGGAQKERALTEDGFERTFQINLLAQFLLTHLLLDKLAASRATVIQTASIAANLFGSDFDPADPESEKNYTPFRAYGRAKLCDVLFTRELQKRFGDRGISAVAFEPGVVRTNFGSESTAFVNFCYHTPLKYLFTIAPEKSARRLTRLAVGAPGADFTPGEFYSEKKPYRLKVRDPDGSAAVSLWDACESRLSKFF